MTDFAVIGGGIAGVSAAAHLAPYGEVTLLDHRADECPHVRGRRVVVVEGDDRGSAADRLVGVAAASTTEVEHAVTRVDIEPVEVDRQHGVAPVRSSSSAR